LRKCSARLFCPGPMDDQDEYKKFNINHSSGANISRSADSRGNSPELFCQVIILNGYYSELPTHAHDSIVRFQTSKFIRFLFIMPNSLRGYERKTVHFCSFDEVITRSIDSSSIFEWIRVKLIGSGVLTHGKMRGPQ
jgi:hypothetical protein